MKLKLFYIIWFWVPNFLFAQSHNMEKFVHKAKGIHTIRDTISISFVESFNKTYSFSFAVKSNNPFLQSPQASISTNQRHRDLNPGCETNTFDLDFVSGLFFMQPDESGDIVITLSNLPDSACDLNIEYYFSENRPIDITSIEKMESSRFDCPCTMPTYVPRNVWGAAYQLSNDIYRPPATITDVTHLIVHHSATANTSNNWPGVVASIFNYHANTNQWQDIGYNWLIDPEGNLYQGRGGGDDVRGAHMCGYNDNTMGICMLGTFTNVDPDPRALATLDSLLAYKSCQKNFNPTTSAAIVSYPGTMFRISGHRDGCAPNYTECPGNRLHTFLPAIRQNTAQFIEDQCTSSTAYDAATNKKYTLRALDDRLQVTSETPGNIVLYATSGNMLWSAPFQQGHQEWPLILPSGIYMVKITIGEVVFTEKITWNTN